MGEEISESDPWPNCSHVTPSVYSTVNLLGTENGLSKEGALSLVFSSLFGTDLYTTSCVKYSTSKYSLPSASSTCSISATWEIFMGTFLNFSKFPMLTSSIPKTPEITDPFVLTAY